MASETARTALQPPGALPGAKLPILLLAAWAPFMQSACPRTGLVSTSRCPTQNPSHLMLCLGRGPRSLQGGRGSEVHP